MKITNNNREKQNLNVLITGSSRGIGRAIAQEYKDNNYNLICPVRDELDLGNQESVSQFVEKVVDLDIGIAILNAGINNPKLIENLDLKEMNEIYQVNTASNVLIAKTLLNNMKAKQFGRFVFISSLYSTLARAGRVSYSMSKSSIDALSRQIALEYAPLNIISNSIQPGFIETELTSKNNSPDVLEKITDRIPMSRLGKPREIAKLCLFLTSSNNTYITGQSIVIDGGYSLT